jgi:hypothetical protein
MVIPRSRSAFSLSSTQAYLKEPFPNSAASYCGYRLLYRPLKRDSHREGKRGQKFAVWNVLLADRVVGLEAADRLTRKNFMTHLLELFDGTLVDTTALIDQMA